MNEKFNKFITFVNSKYKELYGKSIKFPLMSEITSIHNESLIRLGLEVKFFEIEDDLDSQIMLSHLEYLSKHFLIKDIKSLWQSYKDNDTILNDLKFFSNYHDYKFKISLASDEPKAKVFNTFGDGITIDDKLHKYKVKKISLENLFEKFEDYVLHFKSDDISGRNVELFKQRLQLGA